MKIISIPKRNGKFRTIYIPSEEQKSALRAFLPVLEAEASRLDVHGVSHAFTRGRSPVTNAKAHCGWKFTLSMDLKDFFDSVTPEKVLASGVREFDLSCFVDGAARQGLPTSPALANIAASPIDRDICALISKGRFVKKSFEYSRYADDLCFSYDNPATGEMLKEAVPAICAKHGFEVNHSKTKTQAAVAGRRIVTGVSVGDTDIASPRWVKRRIRAGEHQAKHGIRRRHLRHLIEKLREVRRRGGNASLGGLLIAGLRGLREWSKLTLPAGARAAHAQPAQSIAVPVRQSNQTTNAVRQFFGWVARKMVR